MITSGEILFQQNKTSSWGRNNKEQILKDDFLDFLDERISNPNDFSSIMQLSTQNNIIHKTKLSQKFLLTLKSLQLLKIKLIYDFHIVGKVIEENLLRIQRSSDAHFMQLILTYHSILELEMSAAREKTAIQKREKAIQIMQAGILRDVRKFSLNLAVESQRKISLIHVSHGSQQFERCEKAIFDNIDPRVKSKSHCITVQNVFKLQNTFLSEKMQVFFFL